ncbi:MAG: hypothetical protein JXB36_17185 [Gammaproteobacteria bacterium]|nr:hypothetical protein [Gammaproteobacteria bacterium]
MTRMILPLVAGTALGAAVTYALVGHYTPELPSAAGADGAGPRVAATQGDASRDDAPPPVSQRGALYRLAAESDERALRGLLDDAAELPPSPTRSFTVEALLLRYAELDPAEAIERARELRVDPTALAALFGVWARADADAALRALRSVDDRRAVREAALALVDALGGGEAAASRVADAVSDADAAEVLADVVARDAADAPADALQRALALNDPLAVELALRRIGEAWGRERPQTALARSASLDDPRQRAAFEAGVLSEWVRTDLGAAFEHLLSSEPSVRAPTTYGSSPSAGASALLDIARRDPIRVLDAASRLPQPLGTIMPTIALESLADTDPLRAIRYAEATRGPARQTYLQAAAAAWGRRDPDAALAWARRAQPQDRNLLAVVRGIAQSDPDRALDVAMNDPNRMVQLAGVQSAVGAMAASGGDVAHIADRLAAEAGDPAEGMLNAVTSIWATVDPQAAVDWMLANGDRAGTARLGSAAQRLAAQDPALAASYVQRVPAEVRPELISAIAAGYAQSDPEQALLWLEQIRGQPGYESAATAVVRSVAVYDAPAAARLLENAGGAGPESAMAATMIANQWASQDPAAAADWAQRLEHRDLRSSALGGVARQWAANDRDTARAWALGLPRGNERDAALGAVLQAADMSGRADLDRSLLAAFSSDRAAQQALLPVVLQRVQRDPEGGRALMDEYLTDPAMRRQAEQLAERGGMIRGAQGASIGVAPFPGAFHIVD